MAEDIRTKSYYNNWKTVLIPRIQETEAWADLFDAISEVFAKNIYKNIELLRYIRDPSKQDKLVNIQQAKFLGFNYNSDKFTDDEYANIVYFLNYYNRKVKGTYDFINFLGWVKNAKFKLVQLWARGKYNYSDDPEVKDPFEQENYYIHQNSIVDGTGNQEWYPTSHVDLTYNGESFDIDESDVWYLFYKCAPIHLVLRSIAAVITGDPYYLNFNLATNDYTNTHHVIPCIYRNPAKFNLNCGEGYTCITKVLNKSVYGYKKEGYVTYYDLWSFDKYYTKNEFDPVFTFKRSSIATNLDKGWYRIKQVPANYPRFSYTYTYSQEQGEKWTPNGFLIEGPTTNYLLDSQHPISKQVTLQPGTFTFSGKGKYALTNITESSSIGYVEDGSITFTLESKSTIYIRVTEKVQWSWYQLEKGSRATSLAISTEQAYGNRSSDILSCINLPAVNKGGSFVLSVDPVNIAENCILLKIYESSLRYIEIKKQNNKMVILNRNGSENPTLELDFTGDLTVSINPFVTKINGQAIDFPLSNNIMPKYCYIGQDEGREAIFGYVTKFYYIPFYMEF